MFFSPHHVVKFYVVDDKVHVFLLMIEDHLVFYRGVPKQQMLKTKLMKFVFGRRDWEMLRRRYKISVKCPLKQTAAIAVVALIQDIVTTRTIAATAAVTPPLPPTSPPSSPTITPSPPPPTPKCYIACTCDEPDCHLKQQQLQQQHKRSSAKVRTPIFKKKV